MMRRDYLSPTCGECGRTFDLLDADDAAEWAYGHDCEAPEGNTCDGCGKDYPHALTTWRGHAGQGEYCEACLLVAREGNPLYVPNGAA